MLVGHVLQLLKEYNTSKTNATLAAQGGEKASGKNYDNIVTQKPVELKSINDDITQKPVKNKRSKKLNVKVEPDVIDISDISIS